MSSAGAVPPATLQAADAGSAAPAAPGGEVAAAAANPFHQYARSLLEAVPSMVAVLFSDINGHCRVHAVRDDAAGVQWKVACSLHYYTSELERTLQTTSSERRTLRRATLWLSDYVLVQEADPVGTASAPADDDTQGGDPPAAVITLVGKADDGEGDVGAMHALLKRIKRCPVYQTLAAAIVRNLNSFDDY
eukprot:TRINITY_DN8529_c0_g1_i1.p1 TRINITY_DN8529_c0_g1~~TRINITY_DN8529_c0_g1_i1.p1  ORF type:complete len:217 (+),score=53.81 TRINITY_DN8529_c0_g1_i1:80-652(+)